MVDSFRRRRFFRIFLAAEDSQRMETPPAFREYLQDKIPSMFSVVGQSGHTWKVELEIGQHGVLFGNGWENFVDDHSLEFGDLLVFKFDGKSSFSVLVFDKTACEKMSAFSAKPRCRRCSCHKRKGKREAVFVSSSEDSVMEEVEKKAKCLRPSKEGGDDAEAALFSTRLKEAHAKANAFKSSSPSVVVTMRKSNASVGGHLRLPASFSSNIHFSQLSRRKEMILRTPSGGIWIVSLLSIKKQKFLSAGWRKFAVENNLKVDDACVFELRDNDEMLVHIFKVRR